MVLNQYLKQAALAGRVELEWLKREIGEMKADIAKHFPNLGQVNEEQQRGNIRQAGISNSTSDDEVMLSTFLEYMEGDKLGGYAPPHIGSMPNSLEEANKNNKRQQRSIKHAGLRNNPEEMLQTFMEFGGLS
jgi:hypothetical protein